MRSNILMSKCIVISLLIPTTAFSTDFKQIIRQSGGGVVSINAAWTTTTTGKTNVRFGTGFFVDDKGTIITNSHVIEGAATVVAKTAKGDSLVCDLVHDDPIHDLAAIRTRSSPKDVQILQLAKGESVDVSDPVVLIGSPYDLANTAHEGKVAAENRTSDKVTEQRREAGMLKKYRLFHGKSFEVIQINVDVAHGMSGAPVIRADGKVIGVVAAGPDHGYVGIVFAIPATWVRSLSLTGKSSPFKGTGPIFGSGSSNTNLSYDGLERTAKPVGSNRNSSSVGSDNLGVVEVANAIAYVDDPQRFQMQLTPDWIARALDKKRIVHLVNSAARFSVLVPENWKVEEDYDSKESLLRMDVTGPRGQGHVCLIVKKIDRPNPNNVVNALTSYMAELAENTLNINLVQIPDPTDTTQMVALPPPFTDPVALLGRKLGSARKHLVAIRPNDPTSIALKYGITDDLFYCIWYYVDMTRDMPKQPFEPPSGKLTLQALIQASFSSL